MTDTTTYYCLVRISYDRADDYAPGEAIDLPDRDAAALLAAGAISPDAPVQIQDAALGLTGIDAILDAIDALIPTSETAWTKDGKPQVVALERALGYDISAADRDAAWDKHQDRRMG